MSRQDAENQLIGNHEDRKPSEPYLDKKQQQEHAARDQTRNYEAKLDEIKIGQLGGEDGHDG